MCAYLTMAPRRFRNHSVPPTPILSSSSRSLIPYIYSSEQIEWITKMKLKTLEKNAINQFKHHPPSTVSCFFFQINYKKFND